MLKINAEIIPIINNILKAAPYEKSFQTNLCLKKITVIAEPNNGKR